MYRWTEGLLALAALGLVVGVATMWPRPSLLTSPPPNQPAQSSPSVTSSGQGSGDTGSRGRGNRRTAGSTPVIPCPEPGPPGQVSVLTFNIHGGLSRSGYRLERIAQEIAAWDADIVLLQEVDRYRMRTGFDDQPTWLATRLGMNVVFGRNVVWAPVGTGKRNQEYGTAILSRLPVQNWSNVQLPNQPRLEPRGLLRAQVQVGGQWVGIYNTHLQHTGGNIRIQQLRAVRQLVAQDPFPHIVGGDFNATPDSPALGVVRRQLLDPWPAVGVGAGLTVPNYVPRRRIDYLLHDSAWVPTRARTFVSAVSDHRALRVEFDLPRPSSC